MLIWTIVIIAIIRIVKSLSKNARFRYDCWRAQVSFDKAYFEALKKGVHIDFPPSRQAFMLGKDFYLYDPDEEKLKKQRQNNMFNSGLDINATIDCAFYVLCGAMYSQRS